MKTYAAGVPSTAVTTQTWDTSGGLPLLLREKTGSDTTYLFYGPGGQPFEQIDPGGGVLWLHRDQLGSVRLATDSTGSTVAMKVWDAYGNPTTSTGTAKPLLGYAGQYTDAETGYQYLRARYYDPKTTQFLSLDPEVAQSGEAYGYAGASPINASDPTGLRCWTGHNPNGSCRGSGAVAAVTEAAQDAGEFAVRNRDVLATAAAVGVCLSGVGTPLCGAVTAGAYAVRAEKRIREQGFESSLNANLTDLAITGTTFGLVSAPSGVIEKGGEMAVTGGGPSIIFEGLAAGAPMWQIAALRLGSATPDLAGLAGYCISRYR